MCLRALNGRIMKILILNMWTFQPCRWFLLTSITVHVYRYNYQLFLISMIFYVILCFASLIDKYLTSYRQYISHLVAVSSICIPYTECSLIDHFAIYLIISRNSNDWSFLLYWKFMVRAMTLQKFPCVWVPPGYDI